MTFRLLSPHVKQHLLAGQIDQGLHLLQSMLVGHPLEQSVLIRAAVQYGVRMEILQGQQDWREAKLDAQTVQTALLQIVEEVERAEIKDTSIVLYQEGEVSEQGLAHQLGAVLAERGFQVILKAEDKMGLDSVLAQAHYLILLLPPSDSNSPTLRQLLKKVKATQAQMGQPQLIPIQMAWPSQQKASPLLSSLIPSGHYLSWQQASDSTQLIQQILDLLYFRNALCFNPLPPTSLKANPRALHSWTFTLWYFLLAGLFMLSFKCGS